ncbi:MAG: FAD-dependent oxidoreductase [Rhodobacterales bacterium]|nr:FAD-dependent oxidoreductase [Rhodobacterales bacterium]
MANRQAVIIGGGITGALTALELTLDGWSVTLCEAAHIGAGSSSRTAAGIRQQFSTPGTVRGMRYATQYYRDWRAKTGGTQLPIVQNGYLFLYDTDDGWVNATQRVKMQQDTGLSEVQALMPSDLRDRFPWIDADLLKGASWCPTDGFLHPQLVYMDAVAKARELGATILQKAPITDAIHANGKLTAVVTPKGTFHADLFIDCTNAWTARVGKVLDATPLPVQPLKRYLWFLQRDGSMNPDVLSSMPMVIAPSGLYVRPEHANTLQMGKKHPAQPQPNFDYEDQDVIEALYSHDGGIDAAPFELWMEIAELMPPLGEFAGFNATTSGFYGTTPDHNPFLSFDPQIPNLMRLVGFSGHGAMFGPFTAKVAVAMAQAGTDVSEVDVDGEPVDTTGFHIGRSFDHAESMVI